MPAASRSAITGEAARVRVFQMRAASDAIMVGIGTVLSDNPQLTCRLPGMFERSPVRVVLDAKLKLPLATSVVATVRETPTWVFTSSKPSAIAEEILQQKGCKVFRVGDVDGRLDLDEVLKVLAEQGITRLMVEGGPTVAGAIAAAGLVDEVVLLRGEKSIGAERHRAAGGHAAQRADRAIARARQRKARARHARDIRASLDMILRSQQSARPRRRKAASTG